LTRGRSRRINRTIIERCVLQLKDSIEWVDRLEDTSAENLAAIERVRKRLKQELGLEAKLVENHDEREANWVISLQE
jgi:hypothetical protein